MVAIIRKELRLELGLSQIFQVLSVNVFEQIPLDQLVTQIRYQNVGPEICNQLMLKDF